MINIYLTQVFVFRHKKPMFFHHASTPIENSPFRDMFILLRSLSFFRHSRILDSLIFLGFFCFLLTLLFYAIKIYLVYESCTRYIEHPCCFRFVPAGFIHHIFNYILFKLPDALCKVVDLKICSYLALYAFLY